MAVDKSVGDRLKGFRMFNNLSVDEVAERTGVGLCTLKFIESGRYPVSSDILIKLCNFYHVQPNCILGWHGTDLSTSTYKENIREIYEKSYEQYLRYRKQPTNELNNIDNKKPIPTWPYNLFEYCKFDIDVPISNVQMDGLEYVFDNLFKTREAAVTLAYFMKGMTLEQLSNEFNVTKERVRQIIGNVCRKIKHPSKANYIKYGVDYPKKNKEMKEIEQILNAKLVELEKKKGLIKEFDEKQQEKYLKAIDDYVSDPLNTTLDELDLSVRSYNCLARASYWTLNLSSVKDLRVRHIIQLFQSGDIVKIRNLGRKSYEEIRNKLIEIGIPSADLKPIDESFN